MKVILFGVRKEQTRDYLKEYLLTLNMTKRNYNEDATFSQEACMFLAFHFQQGCNRIHKHSGILVNETQKFSFDFNSYLRRVHKNHVYTFET